MPKISTATALRTAMSFSRTKKAASSKSVVADKASAMASPQGSQSVQNLKDLSVESPKSVIAAPAADPAESSAAAQHVDISDASFAAAKSAGVRAWAATQVQAAARGHSQRKVTAQPTMAGGLATVVELNEPATYEPPISTEEQLECEVQMELQLMRARKEQQAFIAEEAAKARAEELKLEAREAKERARVAEEKLHAQFQAQKTREKAAHEAKMAAMSEDQLLNMQITDMLSTDLQTFYSSLELANMSMAATDIQINKIQDSLKEDRATETDQIAEHERNIKSIDSMLLHVDAYGDKCSQLKNEVNQLVTMETQRRMDTHGITGRVRREVAEAQDRLAKQTEKLHNMHRELKKMYSEYHSMEKQQETQYNAVSSEVVAKKLNLELVEQRMALLRSEQTKLQEQVANTRIVEAKMQRVSTTTAQVEEIKTKMALDDHAMAACKAREAELAAEERLAEAQMECKLRIFEADKDSLRSLITMQETFRIGDLVVMFEGQGDAKDPFAKKMLESTRSLVEQSLDESKGRLALIERAESAYTQKYDEAKSLRASHMRQKRAERQALATAHIGRQRFLSEKMSQLEIEEKQLEHLTRTRQDNKEIIKMMQTEIDLTQAALNDRQHELTSATYLKKGFGTQLESLKTANKLNLARMRVAIDSESRVLAEQQSYVDSLLVGMKLDVTAVEETQEEATEAAEAPPQGRHGLALAHSHELAVRKLVDDLKSRRVELVEALRASQDKVAAAEKKAQNALANVDEERVTLQHEISKLQQYRLSIETKLAKIRAPEGSQTDSPKKLPTIQRAEGDQTDAPTTPTIQRPERDQAKTPTSTTEVELKPPSLEATPYRTTNKLLVTSDTFAQPLSPSSPSRRRVLPVGMGSELDDEANSPMYNPDLKPDLEHTSARRASIRSRITAAEKGNLPMGVKRISFETTED
jgi:hypothetical protein